MAALCISAVLAGCSHDSARDGASEDIFSVMSGDMKARIAARRAARAAPAATPAAPDLEALARESLKLNPGPVIFATRDGAPLPALMGMIGENGKMRTYASPKQESLILRADLIVASRGLGEDMISADVGEVSPLIHGRKTGTAARVIRIFDGQGVERPIPLSCAIAPARQGETYSFAGSTWHGTVMAEHCTGQGFDITNSYFVTASGEIPTSRQWLSPKLSYFTIQTLRP